MDVEVDEDAMSKRGGLMEFYSSKRGFWVPKSANNASHHESALLYDGNLP
jgi:hypothetical protein